MKTRDKIIWGNIEDLLAEKGWTLAEFARQVKTRQQTLNSIKFGVRGIGPNLFARFAAALGVPEETLLLTNKDEEEQPMADQWEIKLIMEQLSKRIDAQIHHMEDIAKVYTHLKDDTEKLWGVIHDLQKTTSESDQAMNAAIDKINESLLMITDRMLDAAKSGNVQDLGGVVVNE